MSIIKNILMGLGLLAVFFIAVIAFLASESSDFKKDNEQFVTEFTHNFSRTWNITSVSQNVTNEFLTQINSSKGRGTIAFFQSLGKVIEITDLELANYNSHTDGITTGIFKFKATFENAKTLVTITVREKNDSVKIHGFYIDTLNKTSLPREFNT